MKKLTLQVLAFMKQILINQGNNFILLYKKSNFKKFKGENQNGKKRVCTKKRGL